MSIIAICYFIKITQTHKDRNFYYLVVIYMMQFHKCIFATTQLNERCKNPRNYSSIGIEPLDSAKMIDEDGNVKQPRNCLSNVICLK